MWCGEIQTKTSAHVPKLCTAAEFTAAASYENQREGAENCIHWEKVTSIPATTYLLFSQFFIHL